MHGGGGGWVRHVRQYISSQAQGMRRLGGDDATEAPGRSKIQDICMASSPDCDACFGAGLLRASQAPFHSSQWRAAHALMLPWKRIAPSCLYQRAA